MIFDIFNLWFSEKSVLEDVNNRRRICKILVEFKKTIKSRILMKGLKKEDIIRRYPFQYYMFHEYSYDFSVQRSAVTSMGQKLIPDLIVEIAKMRGFFAKKNYNRELLLNKEAVNEIESYIKRLGKRELKPDVDREINMIIELASKYGQKRDFRQPLQMDIFIKNDMYELYIELKTPKPKKEDCEIVKRRFLFFMLDYACRLLQMGLKEKDVLNILRQCRALGFYYNPFDKDVSEIRKSGKYPHGFANYFFDLREILMCEELWDVVGGLGTFNHLTNIISTIVEWEKKGEIDKACDFV